MPNSTLIQEDWANRDTIEAISVGIKKLAHFLNNFELQARSQIAHIDRKLTQLERRIAFVEQRMVSVVQTQQNPTKKEANSQSATPVGGSQENLQQLEHLAEEKRDGLGV
ncbi:hypothetical protein BKA69DRAFT_513695 [Paraphysoderma sedebokerense]|nr:hypothetical protein BKA69DRAFT_513695 [Paraphysoderma sedebokerense]